MPDTAARRAASVASTAKSTAGTAANSHGLQVLARLGLAARGAVYLLLGVLALLLAFGDSAGETDQRGALEELTQHAGGVVLLTVIAVGLAGYALWRFSEVLTGAAGEGDDAATRAKCAGRGITYALLAASAFTILIQGHDNSQAKQQQSLTARAMSHDGGRWLVGIAGLVIIGLGGALVWEGISRKFEKFFEFGRMSEGARKATIGFGVIGTIARGVVVAASGVLVLVAAIQYEPSKARGIDGALRALRDTPVGPALLVVVALGLVVFGLFGFCEARWRKV